jgi:hypothetical protein
MTKDPHKKQIPPHLFTYSGRGRPRVEDYVDPDEIANARGLTEEEIRSRPPSVLDEPFRNPGKPADQNLNRSLVEGWIAVERAGKKNKQDFVRKWFKRWYDKDASPTDVRSYVKPLNRQLELLKDAMPVAEAGESTGAVSEPDAPNTPARK